MKTRCILLLFSLCSCNLLDPVTGIGTSRWEEDHRNIREEDTLSARGRDTVLYLSALAFPEEYDWRQDSLFSAVCCTLRLYRGTVSGDCIASLDPVLSVPAGLSSKVSPEGDRHHIIGGHVYTEYSDASGTYVGEDGNLLFSFPEREFITGILPDEGTVWTLGRGKSGGFTFRRDGVIVFSSGTGMPFGGFSHPGYGESGALYKDEESICFSYSVVSGGRTSVYLSRDGEESLVLTTGVGTVLDVKSINGMAASLCNYPDGTLVQYGGESLDFSCGGSIKWLSGALTYVGGRLMAAGNFMFEDSPSVFGGLGNQDIYYELGGETTAIVWSDEAAFGAGQMTDGAVFYLGRGYNGLEFCSDFSFERSYLFSQECVALLGRKYYMALTPMDGGTPYVLAVSSRKEVEINGFLTGISVSADPDG